MAGKQQGNSAEQKRQAKQNESARSSARESQGGYDKKLDGPNIPSI
ncbi:hypothetical protein ACFSL6_20165 [Paenibacillus thailandensis]|uniref:Small EDRK-rich factor-like N-terminal domain-containing protein n=1 Tax=Paenibacillus thailandensis TaxID=393250 RepID=A0ABW5QZG8_9BACL